MDYDQASRDGDRRDGRGQMSESEPRWLSMVGHGTPGGDATQHGAPLEAGVHLRWHLADRLGFPPGGFDVFRRQTLPGDEGCIGFEEFDHHADHVTIFGVTLSSTGPWEAGKCKGGEVGLFLPGEQTLTMTYASPVRRVQITLFDTPRPVTGQAWYRWAEGPMLVDEAEAVDHPDEPDHLLLSLYADRISAVTVTGTDLLLCLSCDLDHDQQEDTGWTQLNGERIHLPVTRQPEWPGVHPLAPDDVAEAVSRLPLGLPPDAYDRFKLGFAQELHGLLHDLVGTTDEQDTVVLDEPGQADHAGATPDLRMPVLGLIKLASVNAIQARILGLHYLDASAVDGQLSDYKVVGYWGSQRWPGRHVTFDDLDAADATSNYLDQGGVQIASARSLVPVTALWAGHDRPGLQSSPLLLPAPVGIFPSGSGASSPLVPAVTLRLRCEGDVTLAAYHRGDLVAGPHLLTAGEHEISVDHGPGITSIEIEGAEFTLFEIICREQAGTIGELHYISHRHGLDTGADVSVTAMTGAEVVPVPTGSTPVSGVVPGVAVGLTWDRQLAGAIGVRANAPVQLLVDRDYRDDHDAPSTPQVPLTLNGESPKLITEEARPLSPDRRPAGWEGAPFDHVDRHDLVAGWYGYAVRGIDLFGRVGAAGGDVTVEVSRLSTPPPPQDVAARLLDPDDPHLSPDDRAWADEHGPGFHVTWVWPGRAGVQHPWDDEHAPAFRLYHLEGPANVAQGEVTAVLGRTADKSKLATTLAWSLDPDELVGRHLKVGDDWFPIVAHGTGPEVVVAVAHLEAPRVQPEIGPCSLGVPATASAWLDLLAAASYERRLAVVPVGEDLDLSGPVEAVAPLTGDWLEVTLGVGAAALAPSDIPGVLVCDGRLWPARAHTTTGRLIVEVATKPQPGAAPLQPVGPAATYRPGRRYEAWLPLGGLEPGENEATATSLIGVTSCDGDPGVADDQRWDEPDRGGLGGQPGRESAVGGPAIVTHVDRRLPDTPSVAGPTTRTWAEPADYFGRSRVEVSWSPATGTDTTRVHRASISSVFLLDREARRLRLPPYGTEPFPDDPEALTWLAETHPAVDPFAEIDPDAAGYVGDAAALQVRAAWLAWGDRHYLTLDDAAIAALGDLDVAIPAFQSVTPTPVPGTAYVDEIDGRGRGAYLWRLAAVSAAGQAGPLSSCFGPIWITPVTPPAAPRLEKVLSAERSIELTWTSAPAVPIASFRVYRGPEDDLADVRRRTPQATVIPEPAPTTAPGPWSLVDGPLLGGEEHHYCVTAVDEHGIESAPSPAMAARAVAIQPPTPPTIATAAWAGTGDQEVARLTWDPSSLTPGTEVAVERRDQAGTTWVQVVPWTAASTVEDTTADPYRSYHYRLVARNEMGIAGAPGLDHLLATRRTL